MIDKIHFEYSVEIVFRESDYKNYNLQAINEVFEYESLTDEAILIVNIAGVTVNEERNSIDWSIDVFVDKDVFYESDSQEEDVINHNIVELIYDYMRSWLGITGRDIVEVNVKKRGV